MCRKETIVKCVGLATILLLASMFLFLQLRSVSNSLPAEKENQFAFSQGLDVASNLGLVHDESQFLTAVLLVGTLLLTTFRVQEIQQVYGTNTTILSRNSCCIVPKGP